MIKTSIIIFQTTLVIIQWAIFIKIIFDDRHGKQISSWRFDVAECLAIPVIILGVIVWLAF